MGVSNKKRKAILRSHPVKSVPELADELGLSKREVKGVLKAEGRLRASSKKILLMITGSAVVVAVLALGATSLFFGTAPAKPVHLPADLNLLVVTVDTLRADRLGCYGYREARTPVIDSLAESGVRFANAYCLQPVTLPSHATLFTGTHPAHHGVADNGSFLLPDEVVTVAEELKELGMSTGAVIASFVLHKQFGLDQGFDTYDDSLLHGWKRDAGGYDEMRAAGVSDRALAWIGQNAGKRWFLWLHYYDPHAEYEPPPAHQQTGSHPYDGEVAYVDYELGRVLADLEKRGLRERTVVILTSDHGESLGEHGEQTHGLFLYEAAMRVPLIVSLPGDTPAGKVVTQRVSLLDVAPTIFSVLGRTPPKEIQGRSFMPLLFSDSPDREEAPLILETRLPWYSYGWSPSSAIVADNFKFIKAPKPELYNLRVDPEELENLYDRDRDRAETMARRLETLRAGFGEASLERKSRAQMDEVTRDRLANLGYISSGPPSGKPAKPADVKDRIEELNRIKWAAALHASGNEDEAFSILEELVARSTGNRTALKRLGVWYMQKSEYTKAEKHLKRLIQLDPELVEAYYNLCQIYADSSRFDEASLLAQTVLSKFPRSARAHGLMGNIRLQEKNYGSALEHLNKAIEYYERYHEALANRGFTYYSMGEHEKALADMKRASRIDPGNKRYIRYVEQLEKTAKRPEVGAPGAEEKN